MRRPLHYVAGLLLLVFAFFKGTALHQGVPGLSQYSALFPFLDNRGLFLIAIAIEVAVAVICLARSGSGAADIALRTFVGVMIWYKAAAHFTTGGTTSCGCLGALRVLLSLSAEEESIASFAALGFLLFCTVPGFVAARRGFQKQPLDAAKSVASICFVIFASQPAAVADTLQINGTYTFTRHNAETGEQFPKDGKNIELGATFSFLAQISGIRWRISVTNTEDQSFWTTVAFDGTNTYTFTPNRPPFKNPDATGGEAAYVTISESPHYNTAASDWAHAFIPWVAYGLDAGSITKAEKGKVTMPLPWETSRRKPLAHGWKWELTTLKGGRFVENCRVVRDPSVDERQKGEMLRQEIIYPENLSVKNRYLQLIETRKQIPEGFVDATYTCLSSTNINGKDVPLSGQFLRYLSGYRHPFIRATINADGISTNASADPMSGLDGGRLVEDFRYRALTKDRIFRYAKYELKAGEPWKSASDPGLMAVAADYLKNGPKSDHYAYSAKQIFLWGVGLAILLAPAALSLKRGNKRKQ